MSTVKNSQRAHPFVQCWHDVIFRRGDPGEGGPTVGRADP